MSRVVLLERPKEPLVVRPAAPVTPGPSEVQLRVEACALGQWDWNLVTRDVPPRLPLVPGVEAVGIVEAAGAGVALAPGTRVLVTPLAESCGACGSCRRGEARWCAQARFLGVDFDGALATHVTLPAQHLVPAPSVAVEEAACIGGSGWTAVGAVRASRLSAGATLGVFGVGGVGHLVVQVARARGLCVVCADVDLARLALAAQWGAEAVPPEPATGLREVPREAGSPSPAGRGARGTAEASLEEGSPGRPGLSVETTPFSTGGGGSPAFSVTPSVVRSHRLARDEAALRLDAAVVCTPSTQALQRAVRLVRPGGVVVVVGSSPTGRVDLSLADLVGRGVSVVGTSLGSSVDLAEARLLAEAGKLRPKVETAPLDAAVERLWWLRDGGFTGRLVFVP
ncbi:MAG: alcohol dehydrogenase catalytic domain-containing protein [Myxococcota bacterium]